MSEPKRIVLDANILLRGVFGIRVRDLLACNLETAVFYTPEICVEEALRYVPSIARRKRLDREVSEANLRQLLQSCLNIVECSVYEEFEQRARVRISSRDADDWPVVATALLLNAPIWTEDQDFFGSGIATWTSDKIEIYLRDA
ncbi:MAG: PIN domain-containing protein [Terracidiphilus sp.]